MKSQFFNEILKRAGGAKPPVRSTGSSLANEVEKRRPAPGLKPPVRPQLPVVGREPPVSSPDRSPVKPPVKPVKLPGKPREKLLSKPGVWSRTQPTGTPISRWTAVMPPEGTYWEYNQKTGERRAGGKVRKGAGEYKRLASKIKDL